MKRVVPLGLVVLLSACGGGPEPVDAAEATAQGLKLAQAGRHREAIAAFDDAAKARPGSADAALAAAQAHIRVGDWSPAAQHAERAMTLAPTREDILSTLADVYLATGRLDSARSAYELFLAQSGGSAAGWTGLADVSARLGDLEGALAAYQRVADIQPERADPWIRMGAIHRRAHRSAAAAKALNRAVEIEPARSPLLDARIIALALDGGDHPLARAAAGRMAGGGPNSDAASLAVASMLLRREDYLSAANELEWLLEQSPKNADARLMLGQILAEVGRGDEALGALAPIPADAPQNRKATLVRAQIAGNAGDMRRAIKLLESALKDEPDRPSIIIAHARALQAAGQRKKARARLAAAIERVPAHAGLRYEHALIVHAVGDEEGAMTAMRGVLTVDPDHAGALNYIGYTLAERGESLNEAEVLVRRALLSRPDDAAIIDSLGWVLYRQGRLAEAAETLRRAAKLGPTQGEVLLHLAEVLWIGGQRDEAEARFEDAHGQARDDAERARFDAHWRTIRKAPK